ncbi:Uncharacterized protein SCF082_LOCUS42410 [Durusdinium trenchii]
MSRSCQKQSDCVLQILRCGSWTSIAVSLEGISQVYIPPIFDSSGMEVLTFDSLEEAEAKLNSLKLGEIDEGGGIIFKAGVPVAEKLVLKYCEKEDFHGFLKDVTKEPERPLERSLEDNIKAVTEALLERINELKKLAPEIARLKADAQHPVVLCHFYLHFTAVDQVKL